MWVFQLLRVSICGSPVGNKKMIKYKKGNAVQALASGGVAVFMIK